ncbi:MAG: class II fructose-bisphosphate aldolase [Niabella sp.]
MKEYLKEMFDKKKALVAFNVQNLYQLNTLHAFSEINNVPVIAQFSAKYISYFEKLYGFDFLIPKYKGTKFFFHLDHCLDEGIIKFCIDKGFSSVMYDGSSLPVETNSKNTNQIFKYASSKGCLLEAELGAISGVEDGFGSEGGSAYYKPAELIYFNKNTSYNMLALAIGNSHGVYESVKDIQIDKLAEAISLIGRKFFVLHGGTGMPEEMIQQSVKYGVVKINVSTALKMETHKILKEFISENKTYDELNFSKFYAEKIAPFYESFILKYTA